MSTRRLIGIVNDDKTVTCIYCHFDGYPDHVGRLLFTVHNSRESAEKIISLGWLSSLYKHLDPQSELELTRNNWLNIKDPIRHSFATPHKDVTVAYHRDRGEDFRQNNFESESEYWNEKEMWCSYKYLWKDGKWLIDGSELTMEL